MAAFCSKFLSSNFQYVIYVHAQFEKITLYFSDATLISHNWFFYLPAGKYKQTNDYLWSTCSLNFLPFSILLWYELYERLYVFFPIPFLGDFLFVYAIFPSFPHFFGLYCLTIDCNILGENVSSPSRDNGSQSGKFQSEFGPLFPSYLLF
jgi:hypothetical protein